jgi:hypothetical protein
MSKLIRVMIAIAMVSGIVLLAHQQVAWAQPTTEVNPSDQPQEIVPAPLYRGGGGDEGRGTVKPPRRRLFTCKDGLYSVGGVATLNVENLAHGYCLQAFLWKRRWPPVHVPTGAGDFLADITFLQVFYRNRFKMELPVSDGTLEVCYAVPPGKTQVKIYFLDFYGKHRGKPTWVALDTTVEDGMACAPAQDSGGYALIGN